MALNFRLGFRHKSTRSADSEPAADAPVAEPPRITVFEYDGEHMTETESATVDACRPFVAGPGMAWINVEAPDAAIVDELSDCYEIHPIIREDILNTHQRPKMDDLGAYLFIEMNMLHYDEATADLNAQQFSIILGKGVLLSFQERRTDIFKALQERLRNGLGHARKLGADYLAYNLIDAIVDNYFVVLERVGEKIEDLEDALIVTPGQQTLHELHRLKRELLVLRESVWPLREVVAALARGESPLIEQGTIIYLRDVYDHTIQVIDTLDTYRDMVSGMLDIYLSSMSNRLNEVMKVLTIIATLFMPLTFIAGVYGMNFKHMPELQKPWGYPFALGLMVMVIVCMLLYFRRKKWL